MTIQGLPTLRGLLERFPGVRVLLDHCARPDLSDGAPYRAAQDLFDLAAFPGVHLKLTHRALAAAAAKGASTPADFLGGWSTAYGAGRIAWGSNFPAAEGTAGGAAGRGPRRRSPACPKPTSDADLRRYRRRVLPVTIAAGGRHA